MIQRAGLTAGILISLFLALFFWSRSWEYGLILKPLSRLETTEKIVALTFDDGPSPERTLALLDLLDRHGVKATFFILGQKGEKHPEILRRMVEDGHLLGNHSWSHPRFYFRSWDFTSQEVDRTNEVIRAAGQDAVTFMRPPYSSKFLILPLVLAQRNLTLVTGTYDPPSEYGSPLDPEAVSREILENVRPGSIIYLHDGKDTEAKAFVLSVDLTIRKLKTQGWRFVRLDDGSAASGL